MTKTNDIARGKISSELNSFFAEFNQSVSFDCVLWEHDIALSKAHAKMLERQNIITGDEAALMLAGLDAIYNKIQAGDFHWKTELEDLHMNIESALIEDIGEVGKKLHTGRSRNDQVATAMRLYVAEQIQFIIDELGRLCLDTAQLAKQHFDQIMPGFTHLQAAQPITFGHHLLAWEQMFSRDYVRLNRAKDSCMQVCPLGAAALAGTSHPIDPTYTAKALGFSQPVINSLDSVSDRDFVLETASALSILSLHLSRCAEDLIIWMSSGFQMVSLSEDLCASSSIMPQKQNPDIAELVRGKSGRIFGALQGLLTVFKGQTIGYNKDNQEDKELLFDALKTGNNIVMAWRFVVNGLQINSNRMHQLARIGHTTATDLADLLVTKGVAFRQAYQTVGKLVTLAEKLDCNLWDLEVKQVQQIEPILTDADMRQLSVELSVQRRVSMGGTASKNVKTQADHRIAFWQGQSQ